MSNHTSPTKKGLCLMFTFFTVATWTVAHTALGAGRAVGNSGSFRASSPSRQQMFSNGLRHSRFFGGDGTGEVQVTVEQYPPTPAVEPDKPPANKRAYIQPHWVDGGYGVEVLAPGYWIDTEKKSRR